jgi:hypothetical protein
MMSLRAYGGRRRHWERDLARLFRSAWVTLMFLPAAGTKPRGYHCAMPTPIRRSDEAYGYDRAKKGAPVGALSARAIDRLDAALIMIASANVTVRQREVLWDRARGLAWKQVANKHNLSVRHVQRENDRAMSQIMRYLIEKQRNRMSHKKSLQERKRGNIRG